ncbi:precorrin-2 dehydrogenase/sirohydrochlorin ferrochelatase family protein [Pseudobacteroides cellulosolvens]|uniref:precorrin-2 dehydrogenase n=1 Tax=Pseudobacteroides cellulosolvens ATCC 35603 = DSM 2933 TaxID=398512 RepID=A0A0L6JQF3_9FIRM|nr:bifunctional precorrin-2 dehydrogenase/sirohydrochlorin ferrochelatase [Pseudobacteroides cellulosolvens]KNY28019.1 siroheme synthase [Pseudobacteroides cellulosolvens ATCC 35603 = DSM 2933]
MTAFPFFIDLKGKKCIVVGGGKVASRKVEILSRFNGDIVIISPEISHKIKLLKDSGRLVHISRCYESSDISGAFMIIAATSDTLVNENIYKDAVNLGIFVNVADDPKKCTFFFPSIVKRNDLVIGISTSGSYPALSKQIRKKIDSIINNNINEDIMSILKESREKVINEIEDDHVKAEILDKVLEETVFTDSQIDIEHFKIRMNDILQKYK